MGKGRRGRNVSINFNKRGLILCEGKTEENYFKGLISQERHRRKFSSINVEIYKPKDYSPIGLVNHAKKKIKEAKREKNEYDFVWVLFDKDRHSGIPEAFEIARISKPKIKIAFTIPCFEFFVLLHFGKTTKAFIKCDKVISDIDSKHIIPDYDKSSNLFELLLPHMKQGLENSAWVAKQFEVEILNGEKVYNLPAYSNIHELINYLYSL